MKLQYRETKWSEAETGIEIAPQDQENIHFELWKLIDDLTIFPEEWRPEIGKLYDSGDLEFELKPFWNEEKKEVEQFWILKENIHPSASNIIKQLQSRITELEEQRERLIAELMNAEDKLKSKESN